MSFHYLSLAWILRETLMMKTSSAKTTLVLLGLVAIMITLVSMPKLDGETQLRAESDEGMFWHLANKTGTDKITTHKVPSLLRQVFACSAPPTNQDARNWLGM